MIKTATLTPSTIHVVCDKGTEPPGQSPYKNNRATWGSYLCRRCGLALFRVAHQFSCDCGWPSFDDAIVNTIVRQPDADQQRTEILCARCQAHLGHVFEGEGLTPKNIRYCVNGLALDFIESDSALDTEEAIYAAGCFWGVEHSFRQVKGVVGTEVGFTGGHTAHPTYEQVCSGATHHAEAVRVLYQPEIISYEALTRLFFELHDPTQARGQGLDVGSQYRSQIFYFDDQQRATAKAILDELKTSGIRPVTRLEPVSVFWRAEEYHQRYHDK